MNNATFSIYTMIRPVELECRSSTSGVTG